MSNVTYGTEKLTYKGVTYTAGDLVAPRNWGIGFNTHIILGFGLSKSCNSKLFPDTWYVRLGRPYGDGTCVGTTSPGMLTGAEVYELCVASLLEWDHKPGSYGGNITRCTVCSPLHDAAFVE